MPAARVAAPVQKQSPQGTMASVNGPPIRQRIDDIGGGIRLRSAYGENMRRYDVTLGTGWQDFAWEDLQTKKLWHLYDANGNVVAAQRGVSQWSGNGPVIPAERGCTECHPKITPALESDPRLSDPNLVKFASLHGGYKNNPQQPIKTVPVPIPTTVGPQGPSGPPGPRGEPGRDGADGLRGQDGRKGADGLPGRDVDMPAVITEIREWLDQHKGELKGKDGKDADSTLVTKTIRDWLDEHKDELKGSPGEKGVKGDPGVKGDKGEKGDKGDVGPIGPAGNAPDIDDLIDKIIKKLPPIYIGAKTPDGKITMPATPVKLGQDVFIRVEPPAIK